MKHRRPSVLRRIALALFFFFSREEPAIPATPEAGPYIPAHCVGRVVPANPDVSEPVAAANPVLGTASQLDVFDGTAAAIRDHYVDPAFNGRDWSGITASHRAKVAGGLTTDAFYTEMEAYVRALGDDHSYFASPAKVAADAAALAGGVGFVGIGALLQPLIDKARVTIVSVHPDSPAARAGLRPHDSVLATNGVAIVENGKVRRLLTRGPDCSQATLLVQSPGEPPRDVALVRYPVPGSTPIDARLARTTDGSRVGYILIPSFFDTTIVTRVKTALERLAPLDGLILDNRMNPGGSSTVHEPILALFAAGPVGRFLSRERSRSLTLSATPVGNSQSVPLAVLVSEETVSFGELFAGIVKDIGRGKVVGQRTKGNVETLRRHGLSDGSQVWIASERFDPAVSHAEWERTGIVPDVNAHADWDSFTFENDPGVAAAVTLLRQTAPAGVAASLHHSPITFTSTRLGRRPSNSP
jgi:C-terminal peptidase prc